MALPVVLCLVPFAWDHDISLGIAVLLACVALAVAGVLVPRPYLTFERGLRSSSVGVVTVPPDGLWTVPVANAGDAMGRVVAVRHAVEIAPDADGRGGGRAEGDGRAVVAVLAAAGFVDDYDFLFCTISPGTALAAHDSFRLCELPLPACPTLGPARHVADGAGPRRQPDPARLLGPAAARPADRAQRRRARATLTHLAHAHPLR